MVSYDNDKHVCVGFDREYMIVGVTPKHVYPSLRKFELSNISKQNIIQTKMSFDKQFQPFVVASVNKINSGTYVHCLFSPFTREHGIKFDNIYVNLFYYKMRCCLFLTILHIIKTFTLDQLQMILIILEWWSDY